MLVTYGSITIWFLTLKVVYGLGETVIHGVDFFKQPPLTSVNLPKANHKSIGEMGATLNDSVT
jgi:hypothetical protein